MATKYLKFRTWLLYSNMNSLYVGDSSSLNAIDFPKYSSISLGDKENSHISWVATLYNNETVYISQYVIFKNISYNDAEKLCDKVGIITIDNKSYAMKIMPVSFWINLSKDIYSTIRACGYSVITSTQTDDGFNVISRVPCTDAFSDYGIIKDKNLISDSENNLSIAYIPVLVPINSEVSISGQDADFGDKTSGFGITYSVYDKDDSDSIYIKEELNGKIIREINDASLSELYTFNITSGLFSELVANEMNVAKITASDGNAVATRIYTFKKVNNDPVINYEGNASLGPVTDIPSITYSVSDDTGSTITVVEKLNNRIIYSENIKTNENRTVSISESQWAECIGLNTLEISANNSSGGASSISITFSKGSSNKLEVQTKPSIVESQPKKISLDIDWVTDNATGKVYVSNNALDEKPVWEDATSKVNTNDMYSFTNNEKLSDDWAISVKVIIEKDTGSTSEVSVFGIRGTFE